MEYCKNMFNLALRNECISLSRCVTVQIQREDFDYYSSLIDNCKYDTRKCQKVEENIFKSKKSSLNIIRINGNLDAVNGNEFLIASEFNNYYIIISLITRTTVISELKK